MESYYIELVIDNLYGPTPRLDKEDLIFNMEMNDALKALNQKKWVGNTKIDELNIETLIAIFGFLARETTMFYRDQWRELIKKEIKFRLIESRY